jgi:hypothetical protein
MKTIYSSILFIVLLYSTSLADRTTDFSGLKRDITKYSILLSEYKKEISEDHDLIVQLQTEIKNLNEKLKNIENNLGNLDSKLNDQIKISKDKGKVGYQFYGVIFSVAIAALSLSWNVFNAAKQNRSKIKLDCSFQQQILENGISVKVVEPVLSLSIVNHGEKSKHIEQPFFKFNKKVDGFNTFIAVNLSKLQSYPIKLEPGARKELKYDILSINESIFEKNKNISTLQVIAPDTQGKTYKSKKFKKKRFIDTIKVYNNTKQSS